jgi:hypothetical protein
MSNGYSNCARTEFRPAGRLDSVVHGFEFLDRSFEQHNACAISSAKTLPMPPGVYHRPGRRAGLFA